MSVSEVSQVFQHSGRFVNDASEDRIVTRCSLSAERTQAHNNSDDRITSQRIRHSFGFLTHAWSVRCCKLCNCLEAVWRNVVGRNATSAGKTKAKRKKQYHDHVGVYANSREGSLPVVL